MKPEFNLFPVRGLAFIDARGQLQWRWDYRDKPTGIPFCDGNDYFESFDHWQTWATAAKRRSAATVYIPPKKPETMPDTTGAEKYL